MSQLLLLDPGPASQIHVEVAPSILALTGAAQQLPPGLHLGTMSWAYPGWIGLFFAAGTHPEHLVRHGLRAYARHPLLRTVEIDRTFYEPLPASAYEALAAQVPAGFRFAAKAHEACTTVRYPPHARYGSRAGQRNPRLLDPAYATGEVIRPFVEGLGEKAGPLIFQFSPFEVRSPQRFAEKLYEFLNALPAGPTYAVELRNAELLTRGYGEALAAAGAAHCYSAWGRMPGVLHQSAVLPEVTRRPLVVRWMCRPGDTHEDAERRFSPFDRLREPDVPRRGAVARLANLALTSGGEAFLLVSNHAEGCAPESIAALCPSLRAG